MATTQISLDEYLRTDYEPDCDYVDGELEERNVGEKEHSIVQAFFIKWLAKFEEQWKLEVCPEIRLRISPSRVRIADLAILPLNAPFEAVLTTPPIAVIEVLSPEDRMSRMLKRVADYIAFGVQYVWILDPIRKKAIVYTDRDTIELEHGTLRTENPTIEVPLSEIFD